MDWLALVFLCFFLLGALFFASDRENRGLKRKYKKWKKRHNSNWKELKLVRAIGKTTLLELFSETATSLDLNSFFIQSFSIPGRILWRDVEEGEAQILFDGSLLVCCQWRGFPVELRCDTLLLTVRRQLNDGTNFYHYTEAQGSVTASCCPRGSCEEGGHEIDSQDVKFEGYRNEFLEELRKVVLILGKTLSMAQINGEVHLL